MPPRRFRRWRSRPVRSAPATTGPADNGAGQNGAAYNGAGQNGAGQNGAGYNGAGHNGAGHNGAAGPALAWPGTRPLAVRSKDDFADLLPPVSYGPAAPVAGQGGSAAFGSPGAAPPAGPRARSAGSETARVLLVLATMAGLIAVSVLLPAAGAAAVLIVLILLRSADVVTARRARRGTGAAAATAYYPWAVVRSVVRFILLAPLALLFAAGAAAIAVLASGSTALPKAGAFAAGALVACYCLGPGSASCRRPLSRVYGRMTTSAFGAVASLAAIAALAGVAVIAAAALAPAYWPADSSRPAAPDRDAAPVVPAAVAGQSEPGRQADHRLGRASALTAGPARFAPGSAPARVSSCSGQLASCEVARSWATRLATAGAGASSCPPAGWAGSGRTRPRAITSFASRTRRFGPSAIRSFW